MEAAGTQAKVQRLRAQQDRWMRERASAHERERAAEDLQREASAGDGASGSGRADAWSAGGKRSGGDQAQIRPEELMDTITARITERLREEFKLEAQREGTESQPSGGGVKFHEISVAVISVADFEEGINPTSSVSTLTHKPCV